MLKYFGTDGIRGIAGKTMDEHLIKKVSRAIVKYISNKKLSKEIVIAKDSRLSGDWILAIMQSVFLCNGITVHNVGIAPTASVAYLAKQYQYALGIVISASHNPAEYNGIKLFDKNGYKLDEDDELEIESLMENEFVDNYHFIASNLDHQLLDDYINYIRSIYTHKYEQDIIFDCSNGASSLIIKELFPDKTIIHYDTTGDNINDNCGCTHIEELCKICKEKSVIGFAFDGDSDRLFCVDEYGNVIDGDKNLFILATEHCVIGDEVIGTVASNYGLQKSIEQIGMKFKRVEVGDKYIAREIVDKGQKLGGESSGHTIISRYSTTGDGIITAISIINILSKNQATFSQLLKKYYEFKVVAINLPCSLEQKNEVKNNQNFKSFIDNLECELGDNGRILVRPSGTEPKLRIMVEGLDDKLINALAERVKDYYYLNF